jgi:hypothetical protein
MQLRFQLTHNQAAKTTQLVALLGEYLNELGITPPDDLSNWFGVERSFLLPNAQLLSTVQLAVPDSHDMSEVQDFIPVLLDRIKQELPAASIVLLRNSDSQLIAQQHQADIYGLEMDLREVLNYIFVYNGRQNLVDAFKIFGVNFSKTEEYRNRPFYENEFYFLVFGDYLKFEFQSALGQQEMFQMMQNATTFDEFKTTLNNRGLAEARHREFLSAINTHIATIKDYRNTLMHNRTADISTRENFEQSFGDLQSKLAMFWTTENGFSLGRLDEEQEPTVRQVAQAVENVFTTGLTDIASHTYTIQDQSLSSRIFTCYDDLREALLEVGRNAVSAALPMNCEVTRLISDNTLTELVDTALEKRQLIWNQLEW